MALITEVTPETDIWKDYPNLRLIKEFKELKSKEGDEKSSNLIKSIFLIWDNKGMIRDSGLTEEQLIKDVSEGILNDGDFDWNPYMEFRDYFLSVNLSKMETLERRYENEILGLDNLLKGWEWNKKDGEKKAKLMKEYKPLFDNYIEVREKVKQEAEVDVPLEGNYNKSLLEAIGSDE